MIGHRSLKVGLPLGMIVAIASCQDFSVQQLWAPSYESQLAEHLSNTEATMYGAYWCPHCARQKQFFGNAAPLLPYVECDARGANPQVELCNAVGISAYPTWQINGEFYLGVQPVWRLAALSGFEETSEPMETDNLEEGGFSPAP
ncbi:membrane protein [Leptolyngbya sp. Heron Island J]|uniref:glutaredoxin family protein n=1 Tax=Leptolyngbya sp. Heron Island J TaxID=1385935 RepID=UPI0003B944A0|nr:membrane protein [Leptolyngbya sp. Heron Island J]ESA37201.1 membrane protein [Leptolyngbya sp. Heron Island J]